MDLLHTLWQSLPLQVNQYKAGEWLPPCTEQAIIYRILQGRVEVITQVDAQEQTISQAGVDDLLGVRHAILPHDMLTLKWRALEDTTTEEVAWSHLKAELNTTPGLRAFLQQEARERLYQLLVAVHPLFQSLPRASRKKLMTHASVRLLNNDEQLIQTGKHQSSLYMVIFGKLHAYQSHLLNHTYLAGDVIGETSAFGLSEWPQPHITSNGVSELLEFPSEAILDAARTHSDIRDWLVNLCQERLMENIQRMLGDPLKDNSKSYT